MAINKPLLTIIIPFLNEKEEVRNTVASIREHSISSEIVILLINDNSDDGFDYESVAKEYGTEYLFNQIRLGVAASRDLGVSKAYTKYILFLDAHMRFYDNTWVSRLLSELERDARTLLCCQTKGLMVVDGKLVEIKNRPTSFGAYVDFYNERTLLESHWIFKADTEILDSETVKIPVVFSKVCHVYKCPKLI